MENKTETEEVKLGKPCLKFDSNLTDDYLYVRENCSHFDTFQELREDDLLFDVTIKVEEKTWKAHKVVLSTIPYFYSMFRTKMAESQKEEITLKEFDPEIFELFYNFAYTGNIKINADNIQRVIEGASFFNLQNVINACRNNLKQHLNAENVWEIRAVVDTLTDKVLIQETYEYITENFGLLCQAENFLLIDFETIYTLISDNTLSVTSEEQVFEAVMRWVKHDKNRHDKLFDLVKKVKLPLVPQKYFFHNVYKEELVSKSLDCTVVVEKVNLYHLGILQENHLDEFQLKRRCGIDDNLIVCDTYSSNEIKFECYDSATDKWICNVVYRKNTGYGHLFIDKHLYCVKHFPKDSCNYVLAVDVYDSKKESWKTLLSEIWNCEIQCKAIVNNCLYIWGHTKQDKTKRIGAKYSFVSKIWTNISCCNRDTHYEFCVIRNCMYFSTKDYLNIFQYDMEADRWTEIPFRINSRVSYGMGGLDGKLYVCGGIKGNRDYVRTVDVYDPVTNKWSSVTPMLSARLLPAVIGYMGKLWVIQGNRNTAEIFNPDTGTWSYAPSLTKMNGPNIAACVSRIP